MTLFELYGCAPFDSLRDINSFSIGCYHLQLLLLIFTYCLDGVNEGCAADVIAARRRENNSSSCSGVCGITNWPSGRRLLDYHGRGVDAASPMFGTDAPLQVATGFDDFSLIARPSDSKLIESC